MIRFRPHPVFVFAFLFLFATGGDFVLTRIDTQYGHTECTSEDYTRPQCANQLNDIIRYFRQARTQEFAHIFPQLAALMGMDQTKSPSSGVAVGLGLTNIVTISAMSLCLWLTPSAPYLTAYFIQLTTLPYFCWCLWRLSRFLPPDRRTLFYIANLATPFFLASISVFGKEYLSILIVTACAANAMEKKRFPIIILSFFGAAVREINLLIGASFFLLTFDRIRLWHLLVGIGISIPITDVFIPQFRTFREIWSAVSHQNTSEVFGSLARLQDIPMGQLIVAPIVLLINILGPGFGPTARENFLAGQAGLYGLGSMTASYLFTLFFPFILLKVWREKLWNNRLVWMLSLIITLTAILPLNQLRYYYPMWPLICAILLFRSEDAKARSDRAYDLSLQISRPHGQAG
jgi:hypothetical protein